MTIKVILNSIQFAQYKKDLDSSGKNKHIDYVVPKKEDYPIVVYSDFWDNPNGPYTYTHYWKSVKAINKECLIVGFYIDIREDGNKKKHVEGGCEKFESSKPFGKMNIYSANSYIGCFNCRAFLKEQIEKYEIQDD